MSSQIDFKGLAQELLGRSRELVPSWIPGGKFRGREYVAGSIQGGDGDSFSCNLDTGMFADFADSECRGGDLINLYARIKGINNGQAARELAEGQGYDLSQEPPPPKPQEPRPEPPPEGETCACIHPVHGEPIKTWEYKDADGRLLFYIARYDTADGKQIVPWSWVAGEWKMKGYPAPRPLYGLELLKNSLGKPLLIVEGEKACDAARRLLGHVYCVISWPNGGLAFKRADWKPVRGWKAALLWPDADQPGHDAMQGIAAILKENGTDKIKVINTDGFADGWDAADAEDEGYDFDSIVALLKPRAAEYSVEVTEEMEREPEPEPEPPAVIQAENVEAENAIVQVNQYSSEDTPAELPESSQYWIDTLGIACQKNGNPINNMNNAVRVIDRHPKYAGLMAYDSFYNRLQVKTEKGYRDWEDEDMLFITDFIQGQLGLTKISREDVYHAAKTVGFRNKKNAPKDWMESLVWDGVSRVPKFFVEYYIAEDSDYMTAVSQNFWVGMVARIYDPGCELHNMVILEGPQGIFKSRSLKVLGEAWYSGTNGSPDNKDFFIGLCGKMLVEISELDSFRKAEDTLVKKLLTDGFDRYRDPFGVVAKDHRRTCIFVGTTNEDEYLRDHTGARRFWPVKCGGVNLEDIKRDREQLFAEAVHLFKAGKTWWEMPEQAKDEQESRRISDIWEDMIADYLQGKSYTSTQEIAVECLKIDAAKCDGFVQKRITKILRLMKWQNYKSSHGGIQRRAWHAPLNDTLDF